ncbi:MAG: hypothetical protein V1647_01355 [Pseudomonadota bacterium]
MKIRVVTKKDIEALHGEALCNIQLLEDALSHSITLKKDVKYLHKIPKEEANSLLKKNRSHTLGKAIKIAKKESIYSDVLQYELEAFLLERNWLVHKSMPEYLDEVCVSPGKTEFFDRIKGIANKAKLLQLTIEIDLIEFSESVGLDMSKVSEIVALQIKSNMDS